MVTRRKYTLLDAPIPTITPSEFSQKWLFQWHYVIDRIPSPSSRGLYIMPFTTFNHILELLLEFDSESILLGLSPHSFKAEKAEMSTQPRRRYINPFTPAALLRDAVVETLDFCEGTLGYFPNHTLTEPRSRSRVMREGGQLVELIEKIEEAKRQGLWGGGGQQRSWEKRIRMWLRRVRARRPSLRRSNRSGVWCL